VARHLITRLAVLLVLAAGGCAEQPPATATATPFNPADVMFLQMGLEQIAEGDQVAALASQRATDPRVRAIATELRGQWATEAGTMERWLLGWQQPRAADPSAGAHAGHGELHMLRPADIDSLASLDKGQTFDRTAVSLLLGHLGNCVETSRMESASGAYPPARSLADGMTQDRQTQIQSLLKVAAEG